MRRGLIILVLGLALLGFVAYGTVRAYADDSSGGYPPIIQKLVERSGLNEEEVKAVFDEAREERRVEMQARFEERLNEAVEDGVITAEQKQALLDKQAEMQERHRQMREEMQQWMEENGIDFEKLAPYRVGCGSRGFGKGFRFEGF